MALISGAERGFLVRNEVVERIARIVGFLEAADRFHGVFPHFMNGETGKGVAILVGYLVCWALSWLLVPLVGVFGLWIWGMVDAYQGAQRYNMAHGLRP